MGPGRSRPGGTDDTGRSVAPPSTRHAWRRSVRSLRSHRPSSSDNSGKTRARSVRSPPDSRARTEPGLVSFRLRTLMVCGRGRWRQPPDDRRHVRRQPIGLGRVRFPSRPDSHVVCDASAQRRQQASSRQLAKSALETVALDGGVVMTWHDDPDPRMRQRGSERADVEVRRANSPPLLNHFLDVEAPGEPSLARKPETAPPLLVRRLRICSAA